MGSFAYQDRRSSVSRAAEVGHSAHIGPGSPFLAVDDACASLTSLLEPTFVAAAAAKFNDCCLHFFVGGCDILSEIFV
jgi:hypothetical protein